MKSIRMPIPLAIFVSVTVLGCASQSNNLSEIVHAAVYRVPEGAEFVCGKGGLIAGTFNRRRGGKTGEGRR